MAVGKLSTTRARLSKASREVAGLLRVGRLAQLLRSAFAGTISATHNRFRPVLSSDRIRLHRGQFVAAGVEKVEVPAAGKTEDRFGDRRTGRRDSSKCRL